MFHVESQYGSLYQVRFSSKRRDGITQCAITAVRERNERPGPESTIYGAAFCSPKDEWDDFVGMKLSLEDAVRHFPDDLKKSFFERFLECHKPEAKPACRNMQQALYALGSGRILGTMRNY